MPVLNLSFLERVSFKERVLYNKMKIKVSLVQRILEQGEKKREKRTVCVPVGVGKCTCSSKRTQHGILGSLGASEYVCPCTA